MKTEDIKKMFGRMLLTYQTSKYHHLCLAFPESKILQAKLRKITKLMNIHITKNKLRTPTCSNYHDFFYVLHEVITEKSKGKALSRTHLRKQFLRSLAEHNTLPKTLNVLLSCHE